MKTYPHFAAKADRKCPLNLLGDWGAKSNEESFSFKPDKSIKKFNPLKYVAVGIISIIIISFSYYLIDDYIDEKRIISAEKGQEKIKKNVQKAKFNLGSISPVEINLITEKKSYTDDFPPYSVIAGSFRNINNANKLLESLISEGYNAKIIGLSPNGLHRVAYGSFNSKNEILIKDDQKKETIIQTEKTVIATGSVPVSLPGIEIDEKIIVSSTGALKLEKVPNKMVVVGGGYIGLEMGSVWSRLGAKVEVVEFLDHITPGMDTVSYTHLTLPTSDLV